MSPFRRFSAGVVAAVVLVLASVVPASAHDQLVSSTPSAGARLDAPPASVELEFSAELMDVGALIMVADAAGRDWAAGDATVVSTTVSVPFAEELPVGGYEVRWRVVSSDGAPISGVIPFTVGDAEPLQREAAGEASSSTTGTAQEPADQNTQENEGALRVVLIGAAGAVLAVAVLAVIAFFRRRRPARDADEETPEFSSKPS